VFCPIWRKPWMTIGPETYIHDMLSVCGGLNVYEDSKDRYPTITLDEVHKHAPTVVLLPDEPYPFQPKHSREVIAGLGDVRIHFVDGKDLCWYGPRIAPAIRSLRRLLSDEGGQL
jgi:ABC-type hemin transport system substrate-binding protein